MSALPAAVQKQVDLANKLVEQIYPITPDPDEGEPVVAIQPTPAESPAEPTVEPLVEPPVEPAAELAAESPVEPPVEPPAEPTAEGWEHKYKVLQGKYNAEVPRLIQQGRQQDELLRDMRQQLTNTQTMMASSLNQGSAVPQGKAGAPEPPLQRLVKDDEIHQFGADLHDFIQRTAREEVQVGARGLAKLEQRVIATEVTAKEAVSIAAGNAEEKVIALLDIKAKGWETQNRDPEFLTWLDQVDPYTGKPRGELLSQAYAAHDGPRVVAIFMGFRNENVALTPTTPQTPAPVAETLPVEEPSKQKHRH